MRRLIKAIFLGVWEIIVGIFMLGVGIVIVGISTVFFYMVFYAVFYSTAGQESARLFGAIGGFFGFCSAWYAIQNMDTHPVPDRGSSWEATIKKWED